MRWSVSGRGQGKERCSDHSRLCTGAGEKNVYAVPGDITRYQSVGSNQLIKEGAKVVTEPEDVLEDYVDMLPQDTENFHNPISLERAAEGIEDPEQKKNIKLC